MKRFKRFLWAAAIFQLLTAAVHALSFLNEPTAANDTERTLIDLMNNYKQNLGGMMVTMTDLLNALSACFSLVCLLGGWLNIILLRQGADSGLLRSILLMETIVFGVLFAVMAALTFPPPIALTGLIFVSLLGAYFSAPKRM